MAGAIGQRHRADLLLQGAILGADGVHGLAVEDGVALGAVLGNRRLHLLETRFFLNEALLGRKHLRIQLAGCEIADELAIIFLQAVLATEIGHALFGDGDILAHFLQPLLEIVDDALAAVGGRLEQLAFEGLHDGLGNRHGFFRIIGPDRKRHDKGTRIAFRRHPVAKRAKRTDPVVAIVRRGREHRLQPGKQWWRYEFTVLIELQLVHHPRQHVA
ncbi:hypothetical protein D3C72_900520 [compost metagenome]